MSPLRVRWAMCDFEAVGCSRRALFWAGVRWGVHMSPSESIGKRRCKEHACSFVTESISTFGYVSDF